jgi:acetate kinase
VADAVLTLNAGSSSLKFALFEVAHGLAPEELVVLARGQVEGVGDLPRLTARDSSGRLVEDRTWDRGADLGHEAFLQAVLDFCQSHLGPDRLVCAGHRIVHGADLFAGPILLSPERIDTLERLDPLAPLHQPHNLAAVRAAANLCPDLPQVASFDTAFHQSLSPTARRFALPRSLEAKGVKRYGFHGLSYQWLTRRLAAMDPMLAKGRVIFAHLGAGASLCAASNGVSIDTTMGFTALDGLVMATRCGAIDPGVVLHLVTTEGLTPSQATDLLYKRSGLLGVSDLSSDMRVLLESPEPASAEAVDLFVHQIVRQIGALSMSLGGLDGLVFSAGIGENSAPIRQRVADGLAWFGLELADARNRSAKGAALISSDHSRIKAYVIATDEERMIAAEALSLVSQSRSA